MESEQQPTRWPYTRLAYALVILAWLAYVLLTFFLPVQAAARYDLSQSALSLLRLSFMMPLLIIWLVALGGVVTFKNYARLIEGSREAKGINLIANGLLFTVAYLVVASLLGPLQAYFKGTSYLELSVTLRNHLPMIISFVGFWLIYLGSHQLRKISGYSTWTVWPTIIFILYSIFAVFFTSAFISTPASIDGNGIPTRVTPTEILVFTLILPFLVAWLVGIIASINVLKYAKHTKGVIYRQVFRDLSRGILLAVGFGILVQIISLSSRLITQLNLGGVLLLIYTLIIIYGLGFWYIRRGANRLAKIEVIE